MMHPRLRRGIRAVLERFIDVYAVKSYSQEGEDMILCRIFTGQERGFYVDVGAHHPQRFSNTYFFYKRGWSGISIEPNPRSVRRFQSIRSRDINIQLGVGERSTSLRYHVFDESALNTFDEELVKQRLASTRANLLNTMEVRVEPLAKILEQYLPAGQTIDFLTIDVEGLDFAVLRSNDWVRFRPRFVLVEVLGRSLEQVRGSDIFLYMKEQGYELFAKTFNTVFFKLVPAR
jgi:FkbM family methyltransferase